MATLQDSLVSSSARRVQMRMRPDLSARQHRYQGRVYWVVKDPVGLQYYRFQEEEYAILEMLDGNTSLDEIKDEFEARFPPQKITVEELQNFIGMLYRSGLILVNVPGQGHELKRRRDERFRKELHQKIQNFLSLRFKGIDPDWLLTWMDRYLGWIYSPVCVFFCVTLAACAALLVTVQFDVFQSKLPTFHQFFTVRNVFWLSIAMGTTKIIHEFGHGLTCKHFGGECHEMGVMLLVLTPCLYCNVTDSWMLPNKWHRAFIGAAGIYVEMVIASICTFVWWFTEPGMLNHVCLSTMFVCGVSTLVFNGNPLMRYDGYYILADLIEIPNLQQKATEILSRKAGEWFLGMKQPENPFLPHRHQALFATYAVTSTCYRWLVILSILIFFNQFWKPYRLEIIGYFLLTLAVYGMFVSPLWRLGKYFYVPGRIDQVKKPNLLATLGVVTALIIVVVFVPLPYRVLCPFEVQPVKAKNVFVEVPGRLQIVHVQPGIQVPKGTVLAELKNEDVDLAIADLEAKQGEYRVQLDSLIRRSLAGNDHEAKMQVPEIEKTLLAVTQQLTERIQDRERLTLKVPAAGTILPPIEVPAKPDPDGRLPVWSGTPLKPENLGCTLQKGSLFCQLGDPKQMEAVLVVDEAFSDFVETHQTVTLQLDELPGEYFHGLIEDYAKEELKVTPKQLSNKAGGELATKTDESGVERPMTTSYQARVTFEPLDLAERYDLLRMGLRGNAKIHAVPQTLGQRIWRYLTQTFNFRM